MLVICVDLFTELVDKLVKAQVDLSLYLVVQELLLEHRQGVVGTVVVQVQWVENAPDGRGSIENFRNAIKFLDYTLCTKFGFHKKYCFG